MNYLSRSCSSSVFKYSFLHNCSASCCHFFVMRSSKFVIKCGNFAVLVELHILPLGGQCDGSWFSPVHRKEVGSLIRDSVEQKVRQFQEARHHKIQVKPRKDLSPSTTHCVEGGNVRVAVRYMKRHINLRCVVRHQYRELRVFPERVVVCASPSENSQLPNGNLIQDVTQQSGQSRSKYFSSPGETQDPLPSSTATKRAVLQKIARQANTQPRPCRDDPGSTSAQPHLDALEEVMDKEAHPEELVGMDCVDEKAKTMCSSELSKNDKEDSEGAEIFQNVKKLSEKIFSDPEPCLEASGTKRRQRTPGSSGECSEHQKAKRLRLGEDEALTDANKPPLGIFSMPGSSCSPHVEAQPEIRLEQKLLTHGNGTAGQTNQSRLAQSLRGLSVKPASCSSSISSRTSSGTKRGEESRGSVPRTSRLRRLKKS